MTTDEPTSTARHVLVVDDDELLREVAKASLELVAGWRVTTAMSGVEAHRLAALDLPDAILLDVMMPGLDGPSTVTELRSHDVTRGIPIIFLTAKSPSEDAVDWRRLRLAGVIAKPFDPMTLAAEMSALLGWQE